MTKRKLEALRNLAERPGTEAEGIVALEMLKRAEQSPPSATFGEVLENWHRSGNSRGYSDGLEGSLRDPRGARVYYNYRAYKPNDPGMVVGYSIRWLNREMDIHWVRVKFDNLKTVQAIPAYTLKGWHLSTVPLEENEATRKLRGY